MNANSPDKVIYLTYLEGYTGVIQSQVIDVVDLINERGGAVVTLVTFISLRNYFKERKILKSHIRNSIIFPSFPGIANWRYNFFLLFIYTALFPKSKIIARNPFACGIALKLKQYRKKLEVIYDGRGAIAAESSEYHVYQSSEYLENSIEQIEKTAVLNSNFRIAVSNNLVSYWQEKFGYSGSNHVVIPCTLSNKFSITSAKDHQNISKTTRASLGFSNNDIVFVYSGSAAEWQSFGLIKDFICLILSENSSFRFILLAKESEEINNLISEYPDNIRRMWVSHQEVLNYLLAADYGLLFREDNITNKVAAPTKFAEYLACGLNVLLKGDIGDYKQFIIEHNCGQIIEDHHSANEFLGVDMSEKERYKQLAMRHFSKKSDFIREKYDLL